ncbi:MAG: glycosyltransferase family 4 protein [Brevinematales bacterium]|nr:glycosyltransferase family 4 protein [Brevinematales bacterium]
MKVLVINWRDIKNPEAGGAEIHIDEILKRKPADWQVDFVAAEYPGCIPEEDINGYHVIRIPDNFRFNFTFKKHWLKRFAHNGYDFVIDDISKIPHAAHRYIGDIPYLAIHHHVHGKSMFNELFFPMALYVYLLERHFLKMYRNIPTLCVSQSNFDALKQNFRFENTILSFTGLTFDEIRGNMDFPKEAAPTLFYFGRLKKYKRVDHIIRAFRETLSKYPDAKLWIAGKGDREDNLKQLCVSLGIADKVTFFGFVDENKKFELMARSWVYAIASEKEGWGLTVMESSAAGLPVVGYRVEGLVDSISDGYSGYLIDNGRIDLMAEKIMELFADPSLRDKMSKNAVIWASRFSWENTAMEFYEITERVIGGYRGRSEG